MWLRAEGLALLELAAVTGIALAQPMLDITGASPDFFLFYGAGRGDILTIVAIFVLVPPLALWLIGMATGLAGARVRRAVHVVTLGALLALLALQVGKQLLPVRGWPLAVAAAPVGAALALAYWRWEPAKQVVRLAAIGPVAFTLLFVFVSPASAVVLGRDGSARAADGTATGPNPPVVMIIMDEFPLLSLLDGGGNIDARRYPNFARLAGGSTWYRNSTAVSGWTPHALPAMLTGRFPETDRAPHYSQYPQNLFTLLSGRYDLRVQESITQLCPPRSCERDADARGGLPTLLGESATLLQEIISPEETQRDPTASFAEPTVAERDQPPPTDPKFRWDSLDDNQPVRFRDFVTGLATTESGDRPTAHVVHLLMPHTPWRYLPAGETYEAPEDLPTGGSAWWPQLAHQRHLLQLRYADNLLGETLRALEISGGYDESLIVLTADHGLTFSADSIGRGMGHLRASPAETMWVPTFVKAPYQRTGAVDDRNWQHVDLVPTIAAHAGLTVPWKTDGVSALDAPRAGTDKSFYDRPGQPVTIDGAAGMRVITGQVTGFPDIAPPPRPELVGRATSEFTVVPDPRRATVTNRADFGAVPADRSTVPALVYGTVPDSVGDGATLVIAVNGRIGAAVPVQPRRGEAPRFAGVVPDPSLFRPGANTVEVFVVDGPTTLRRLLL